MFGNCDQIVTIPSTTNQWSHPHQNQIDDCKGRASSMDQKPAPQDQQQQALKCPRCDSSNTKFCYYNNYSLSQPRHFCKACKRYWTRGGTLRNVPVGGGCRRNKRTLIKRPSDISSSSSSSSLVPTSSTTLNNISQPHIDNTSSSSMFHGLSSNSYNPCDVNLPFSRLFNYDLHPQVNNNNSTGLGFSSGFMSTEAQNGFTSYGSIFRSSSSSSSTSASSSVMPNSMLNNSNMLQQKLINHGSFKDGSISNTFQGLEQMQTGISNGNSETALKDQIQHVGLYDPSLYWNNNTPSLMGLWNIDQPNLGPSVTSFI